MSKCLVIGGAGFIGSNLVDKLIEEGHEVIVIDDLSTGIEENINPKADFQRYDISYKNNHILYGWKNLWKDIEIIFYLAAKARVQPSIEEPLLYHDKNVNSLLKVLEECRKHKIKRFVYSSSSSVYGDTDILPTTEEAPLNPKSPYALQKLIGEQYCKLYSKIYGIETVCLRYFNVYGERQLLKGAYALVMGIFAQQRLDGKPMTIRGDGKQRRDFTYVGDVVDANIKAGFSRIVWSGDTFNIGNGDNRSVNQLADMIGGDRVNIDPVIEPRETLEDNGKANKILGWKPTVKIENWVKKWKKTLI